MWKPVEVEGKFYISNKKNTYNPLFGEWDNKVDCQIRCYENNVAEIDARKQKEFDKLIKAAEKSDKYESYRDQYRPKGRDYWTNSYDLCC